MLNHVEQFEVLDNQGHKTGKIKDRGLMLLPGEYMGVVTIIVVNNKGEVLVTKRHPNKAPGLMWEVTGGGILAYEKPKMAAVRELREETGILINESDLIGLSSLVNDNFYCYQYIVFLKEEVKLSLANDEVIDYKFLSLNEFFHFIKSDYFISYIGSRIYEIKGEIEKIYSEKVL